MKYIISLSLLLIFSSLYSQKEALRAVYLKNGETFECYNWREHETEYKFIFYLNPGKKSKSVTKEYQWDEVDSFTDVDGELMWVLKNLNKGFASSPYSIEKAYGKNKVVYFESWYLVPEGGQRLYNEIYSYEIGQWTIGKTSGKSKKSVRNREILKGFFEGNEQVLSEMEELGTKRIKPAKIKEWVRKVRGKVGSVN